MSSALVTGASRGLGLAVVTALSHRGWQVTVDARDGDRLRAAVDGLTAVSAVPGDVADPGHRARLAGSLDELDLLVLNASELGPTPLPVLADLPTAELHRVYDVNVFAPFALVQLLLPMLRRAADPVVVSLSSDAAVEAYPGWGGYGSSKAALDQLVAVLGVENGGLRTYALDPGDMRTQMHQRAFPGEDISDRPAPDTVVPAVLRLVDGGLPSGRYRAADLLAAV